MNKITIEKEQAGKRIDKFLAEEFFFYTRGEIIKKIKSGQVLINGQKIKPSYILKENNVVTAIKFEKTEKKLIPNKKVNFNIIFKDKNIIIINKPAGLKVHPSNFAETETLVNELLAKFPEIENVDDKSPGSELRPGIVHRLDKDTSGVMVIARNQETFDELKKLFKNKLIEKKYVAVCEGIFNKKEGIIEKPIARASNYRKQVIARKNTSTKVREAITNYKIIKECGSYSIVEVSPKTGRMHQIRIHLSSIGHPVVGDLVYAEKTPKIIGKKVKRQLLHARELKFELFGKKYAFSAPIPKDFGDFLADMKA